MGDQSCGKSSVLEVRISEQGVVEGGIVEQAGFEFCNSRVRIFSHRTMLITSSV